MDSRATPVSCRYALLSLFSESASTTAFCGDRFLSQTCIKIPHSSSHPDHLVGDLASVPAALHERLGSGQLGIHGDCC